MHRFLLIFLIAPLIGYYNYATFGSDPVQDPKESASSQTILSDTPCIPKLDTLDRQKILRKVEFAAEFPGGQSEYVRFLQKNLRYPAEQDDGQDRVTLTFIVDTLGNIRNPCVLNTPAPSRLSPFDSSVLCMFQSMPKWKPGEMNGQKVYYRHFQSVNVCLQ